MYNVYTKYDNCVNKWINANDEWNIKELRPNSSPFNEDNEKEMLKCLEKQSIKLDLNGSFIFFKSFLTNIDKDRH